MSFHFLRPYYLFSALPLLGILWILYKRIDYSNTWRRACDPNLLPHLLNSDTTKQRRFSLFLFLIAGLLTVFALAGPTWSRRPIPMFRNMTARVIVLDLSPSMLAEDIPPNRIERARYKLLDILKQSRAVQTGLIVFSGEPYVVTPLTQDSNTIAAMVPSLSPYIMPSPGNDMKGALLLAAKLIRQGAQGHGEILLITDNQAKSATLATVEKLSAHGINTSVLGIGTREGAPIPLARNNYLQNAKGDILISKLDTKNLNTLAHAGGGRYATFTNSDHDLNALLKAPTELHEQQNAVRVHLMEMAWIDRGRDVLLLLLPIVALAFRRGWFDSLML